MRVSLCLISITVTLALSGCLIENMAPVRALTDQVYAINDEARWSRIDLATERVDPAYRETYLRSHRQWGHDIRIADTDTTHVTLSRDNEAAISLVTIAWYDQRTMELYQSVIRQRWRHSEHGFRLDQEVIVGGREELLDLPDADDSEGEASGLHADRRSNAS